MQGIQESVANRTRVGARALPLAALAILCALVVPVQSNAVTCPGTLSANYTANEDIVAAAPFCNACITSSTYVVNMGGHDIVCNCSGGCGLAVSGFNLKNGKIRSGTGDWSVGMQNPSSGILEMTNVTVDGAGTGLNLVGSTIAVRANGNVFKNVSNACIFSAANNLLSGNGSIEQNYCSSDGAGIDVITGNFVGIPTTIRRNYVQAAGGVGIGTTGLNFTLEHNIVGQGTPPIDTLASSSENICSDPVECPHPGSNFSLTLNFNP